MMVLHKLLIYLIFVDVVIEGLILFQNDTQYVYTLTSNSKVESAGNIAVQGQVAFRRVPGFDDELQEICLHINNLFISNGEEKVALHDEEDLTQWFSFSISPNGNVSKISYPPDEDPDIIFVKKGVTSILAGHFKSDLPVNNQWTYEVNETGHNGEFLASYTAEPSWRGIVFTKTKKASNVRYGHSHHFKETHYNSNLKVPETVRLNEHFIAPNQTEAGFDPFAGMAFTSSDEEKDLELPPMMVISEAELTFVRKEPGPNWPMPEREDLVFDSLAPLTQMQHDVKEFLNDTELWEFIKSNLTCLRKDDMNDAVGGPGMKCFQSLVSTLQHSSENQIKNIVQHYLGGNYSRDQKGKRDRINLLDALSSLHVVFVQDLLTDTLIRAKNPVPELVERFIIHAIDWETPPAQQFLDTMEDMVFKPHLYPDIMTEKRLQRTSVMVLGAIASTLHETGYTNRATELVSKIEENLGIHDPIQYHSNLHHMPIDKHNEVHLDTVAMIEALGNAALDMSFECIRSFVNASETPSILKRAGLNALRGYHNEKAAEILLASALDDAHEHVRHTAVLLYKAHPNGVGGYSTDFNNSQCDANQTCKSSKLMTDKRHGSRVKRGFWEGFEFNLRLPSYNWVKMFGGKAIGASIGLSLVNQFELQISPLSGRFNVEARDEAFARAHIGLLNINLDLLVARFCFHGHMGYKINILKEFRNGLKNGLTKLFDKFIRKPMDDIKKAVDTFKEILSGIRSLPSVVDSFISALDAIPRTILNIRSIASEATSRFARLAKDLLPPIVQQSRGIIMQTVELYNSIKVDLMDLFNAVSDDIHAALPWIVEQITGAVAAISERIFNLFKAPLPTLDEIFKGVLNNKVAVDAALNIKKNLEGTNLFGIGLKPFWNKLKEILKRHREELIGHKDRVLANLSKWIADTTDTIEQEIRQFVKDEMDAIFNILLNPIEVLKNILSPFLDVAWNVLDLIKEVKAAFQSLRKSFQEARTFIRGLFGPKVHINFPREYRLQGGGCSSDGFYPTTANGFYPDQGVDLVAPSGGMEGSFGLIPKPVLCNKVVSPFSGAISVPQGSVNRVQLIPSGGSLQSSIVYIDNVVPASNIPTGSGIAVIAGTPIGTVSSGGPCGAKTHIHLVVKSYQSDRTMELLGENDDTSESQPTVMGVIDPSSYLQERPIELQKWVQECDDYKVARIGKTYIAGSLREGVTEKNLDLSLPRISIPPISEWKIDLSLLDKIKLPKLPDWADISGAISGVFENLGFPDLKFGDGFKFDFKLGKINLKSILSFLDRIGLGDLKTTFQNLIKKIADLIAVRPCVDIEALTSEQLVASLTERGQNASGSHNELQKRYSQPDDRCPLLQISLPPNSYCRLDPSCLGVECCVNVKVAVFKKNVKAFLRFDPCKFQLLMGIDKWTKTIQILNHEWETSDETSLPFKFKIPFLGKYEAKARYKLEKTTTYVLASLSVGFCDTFKPGKCLPFFDILKDSVFPIPYCHENGSKFWSDFNVTDYFNRSSLIDQLEDYGQDLIEETIREGGKKLLEELGLPSFLLDETELCVRPENVTATQLNTSLVERGLEATGEREQLVRLLSEAERTCRHFTLPAFPEYISKHVYCSVREDCFRIDCCLDVNITVDFLEFRRSFRAFMELDPCDISISVGFESLTYKRLIFSLPEGYEHEERIGAISLKYSMNKNAAGDTYVLDFSISVCLSGDNCVIDVTIIEDYQFPIPLCNSNFSLALPGGFSLSNFLQEFGTTVAKEAVDALLEYLGLKDKLADVPCNHATLEILRGGCPYVQDPEIGDNVTCTIEDRCLGVQCCMDIDLQITQLSVRAWLRLDPCDFILNIGFGKWTFSLKLFRYNWGVTQTKRIGRIIQMTYMINKIDEDKEFEVDLGFSVCLHGDHTCFPISILEKHRFPIPICNENFTLPDNASVAEFLEQIGENIGESATEAVLRYLQIAQYISVSECQKPQVIVNGWETECPMNEGLPNLPEELACRRFEDCLAIDCCVELDIIVTTISTRFWFYFDLCDYIVSIGLGEWQKNISMFDFDWNIEKSFKIGKPLTVTFKASRNAELKVYQIDLTIEFCIDDKCFDWDVLEDTHVPIPFCHPNASISLPGDGTIAGFVSYLGNTVKPEAIEAVARKLDFKKSVWDSCKTVPLAPLENVCPSLNITNPSTDKSCFNTNDDCIGVHCCLAIDILITKFHVDTWIVLDKCNLNFSVGLGSWSFNWTPDSLDVDVINEVQINKALKIRYAIKNVPGQSSFEVNLEAEVCIDEICASISILEQTIIKSPLCEGDFITLPGDGTVKGFLQHIGGEVTEAGIDMVFQHLGLQDYISEEGCDVDSATFPECNQFAVQEEDNNMICRPSIKCFGINCCLNMDFIVVQRSVRAWFSFDPCQYVLSVGVGKWFFDLSLFSYDWGLEKSFNIGKDDTIMIRFHVDKLEESNEFEINLSMHLKIDDEVTQYDILDEVKIPIPGCNGNPILPNDWTVSEFVDMLGGHIGQIAIDTVIRVLGLQEFLNGEMCSRLMTLPTSADCPTVSLPALEKITQCFTGENCLSIHCCVAVDFEIAELQIFMSMVLDPCNYNLLLEFGTWQKDIALIDYEWGEEKKLSIGNAVTLRYAIDKLDEPGVLVVNLNVEVCIDNKCKDKDVLENTRLKMPLCAEDGGSKRRKRDISHNNNTFPVKTFVDKTSTTTTNEANNDVDLLHWLGISDDILHGDSCDDDDTFLSKTECLSPSSLSSYCGFTSSCSTVSCCIPLERNGFKRFFQLSLSINHDMRRMTISFEKWTYNETIQLSYSSGLRHQVDIGNVKLIYKIDHPHRKLFIVSLSFLLCSTSDCDDMTVLLNYTPFVATSTVMEERKAQRIRRQISEAAEDIGTESSLFKKAKSFWNDFLSTGKTTFSPQENMETSLLPEIQSEISASDENPTRRLANILRIGKDLLEDPIGATENLFDLREDTSVSDIWQGLSVIGGGLTSKGVSVLTKLLSGKSIEQLEGLLDVNHLDESEASDLMAQLREVYKSLTMGAVDTLTSSWDEDEFKSGDNHLDGEQGFPKIRKTFYKYQTAIPVAGILWITFEFGVGGYFSMNIPFKNHMVTMETSQGIAPGVGLLAWASVGLRIIVFDVRLILEGAILDTRFPFVSETEFDKFPVDMVNRVDIQMIPLSIRLYVKITFKIKIGFIKIKKTLFNKNLWRYSTPAITRTVWREKESEPDKSPPQIVQYSTEENSDVVEPTPSRHCLVKQIYGLDYTEPAFELILHAIDDKSKVLYAYSVGVEPGGTEIINNQVFGGPSAILSLPLSGGVPLYFTVAASNSASATAIGTCSLPTYDVTLPGGRIDPNFLSTSHPSILQASAVIHEDSEILSWKEGIGYGIGIWGDNVVPWTDVEDVSRDVSSLTGDPLQQFTSGKLGRLVSKPIAITTKSAKLCAQDCLDLPSTKCLSFNYDYGRSQTCELLQEIEGHEVELYTNEHYYHYERLGIGHAIEIDHMNIPLIHNQLYYFNIHVINYVGYENVIASRGIIVDFTPPVPGPIDNASLNDVISEPCIGFVSEEWQARCIMDTPLPNHRTIIDGSGSGTVFNGHEDLVDKRYSRANTFISANWDGIHDNETGIYGYTWTVGTAICGGDISDHIDPHSHLFDESEWTHEGLVKDIHLPDDSYYITVRAINKVEFGGPMALTVCHSIPLIIDNTPPIITAIWNITYDSDLGVLSCDVNALDLESGIKELHISLGNTPWDSNVLEWQKHPPLPKLIQSFRIPDGVRAWVKVRAVNNVNLTVSEHADTPIIADESPPVPGHVFDGFILGHDLQYSKERNEICTNWKDFSDPDSGIGAYFWGVGTRPGLTDTVTSLVLNYHINRVCSSDVTLQHGIDYFSTVVAVHGASNGLNVSVTSNGVLIDLTPPEIGDILDGNDANLIDIDFSSDAATISAQWNGFSDPESEINNHEVSVYRKKRTSEGDTDDFILIHQPEIIGKATSSIEWHHFHLHHTDYVKVNIRVVNGADSSVEVSSDGYLVDLTPPQLFHLGDGSIAGEDVNFQVHDDEISVNWRYEDDESGIDRYGYAIYELRHGSKRKIFPNDGDSFETIDDPSASGLTKNGLQLRLGAVYITRVTATNGAMLVVSHETTGVRVDTTPPKMAFVRAGVVSGKNEELYNGFVYQNDLSGIQASWFGIDGQSSIKAYWVTVGTQPHLTDVQDSISFSQDEDGYIGNLDLGKTEHSDCGDSTDTSLCQFVYYVCVKAENGAGQRSDAICSSPIKVVEADQRGYIRDGAPKADTTLRDTDLDVQLESHTITVAFSGFQSPLYGISHYEWAVGSFPGGEDIQPFGLDGIILQNSTTGTGKGQSFIELQHGMKYFSTIRAINGAGHVIESSSDGVIVDQTPPEIELEEVSTRIENNTVWNEETSSLYIKTSNGLFAKWRVEDNESDIHTNVYYFGTHPYGFDVVPVTHATDTEIAAGEIDLLTEGLPNILTLQSVNAVRLKSRLVYSASIVVDFTPPTEGELTCPSVIHSRDVLECKWSGFLDDEATVSYYRFLLGSEEGLQDTFSSDFLSSNTNAFRTDVDELHLQHNKRYYATLEAFNTLGQRSRAFSEAILIDETPPIGGLIVELPSKQQVNTTHTSSEVNMGSMASCSSEKECLDNDARCIESVTHITAVWQPFIDEETDIVRYEIAVGTTPSGTQLRSFFEVPLEPTLTVISNLDLTAVRQVFVTLRGYNAAGLTRTVTSNGVFISRQGVRLPPLYPLIVRDGPNEEDMEIQTSLEEIRASWDFSGDPCPVVNYEWAIYRLDGLEVQGFVDVGESTSGSRSELQMADDEKYFSVVRATNALGVVVTRRSDSVTIKRDPLVPGRVFDGPFTGQDLNYQIAIASLSATWEGFGEKEDDMQIRHSGNDMVSHHDMTEQTVEYYEVAVGTDRRFPKTKDNVIPFSNVGRNTSVTFEHLELNPNINIYYFTVRAYSASFATASVTSNGITVGVESFVSAGDVNVGPFLKSLNEVDIQWTNFESPLSMRYYYVGIGTSEVENGRFSCKNAIVNMEPIGDIFDVYQLRMVGANTYYEVSGLNLTHNAKYFVTVIGFDHAGECNLTTMAFRTDSTNPSMGRVRAAPFYNMKLEYTSSADTLPFWWEHFEDDESSIQAFNVRLQRASHCSSDENPALFSVVDWIALGANLSHYSFVDLELQPNRPYFIDIDAVNHAGGKTSARSSPILLDTSEPTDGVVVDGGDFTRDKQYHGDPSMLSGTFLHLPHNKGDGCPLKPLPVATRQWDYLSADSLLNMDKQWNILYTEEQIEFNADETQVSITMERDIRHPRMISGAYATDANILKGGQYTISIKAASADEAKAITSVLLWDGTRGKLGELNRLEPISLQTDVCSCCFDLPVNEMICRVNCTKCVDIEETFNNDDDDEVDIEVQRACGLQLIPDSGEGANRAAIWCRYENDGFQLAYKDVVLEYDPSKEWHDYTIRIATLSQDALEDQWRFELYIDGIVQEVLDGIPPLSTSTQLILHVWNEDNYVPLLSDMFDPVYTVAYFQDISISPDETHLCRYGTPYRAGSSPVAKYMAGVGSQPDIDDIVKFREVSSPCIPCVSQCDVYHCDENCDEDLTTYETFTIENVDLPEIRDEFNMTWPLFTVVKAVLANGNWKTGSSNGFRLDTTPPDLEIMFYIDLKESEYEPTTFQSSNNTIMAYWSYTDYESDIIDYQWAIGTSQGATDLQDFVSVGLNQTSMNVELDGLLFHNQTYYVTLKATNGAGLQTVTECEGVTVLLETPTIHGVNTSQMFSEEFPVEVYPPNAMKTDGNQIGATWSTSDDPSVTRYEYCAGSSEDQKDDIMECVPVALNSSGAAAVMDGQLVVISEEGEDSFNISGFRLPNNTADSNIRSNNFNLEPGKSVHNTIRACNSAHLCSDVDAGSSTVVGDDDELLTSSDGEDIVSSLVSGDRRRRQADDETYHISIQTTGGLHEGGSLLVGFLTGDRSRQVYESDGSPKYKSYIANPSETLQKSTRSLRRRIQTIYEPTFFISSIGQIELSGPLIVNITLPMKSVHRRTTDDTIPRLIFWDENEWKEAVDTCLYDDAYDEATRVLSTQVCRTRGISSTINRNKRAVSDEFFVQETQFAVVEVTSTIPNDPPEITNLIPLMISEDEGAIEYQIEVTDPDDDEVIFTLNGGGFNGEATLEYDGKFMFTPCKNCFGTERVSFTVREIQTIPGVEELSVRTNVEIQISGVNDDPVAYVSNENRIVGNERIVRFAMDGTDGYDLEYKDLQAEIGAFDVDTNDYLTLQIQPPLSGQLSLSDQRREVPDEQSSCSLSPDDKDFNNAIPCGLVIPTRANQLSWVMLNFTYQPNENFVGEDSFRLFAQDQDGAMSRLLTVYIDVYEPCKLDECQSTFMLEKAAYEILEREETFTVAVVRGDFIGRDTFVSLDLISKEATVGTDVSGSRFQVKFFRGQSQVIQELRIVNDQFLESDETFLLRLSSPIGGTIQEPSEAVITIVDDESSFNFKYDVYQVNENAGYIAVTIVRGDYIERGASVRILLISINASASVDFASATVDVYFQSGQRELSKDIAIFDDDSLERTEIFIARLTSPEGGVIKEPSDAVITIYDDEEARGFIEFTDRLFSVAEDNDVVTIPLIRTASYIDKRVTIRATTSDISTRAGEDYVETNAVVEFFPDVISTTVQIPIIDDFVKETVKVFRVSLSDPSDGVVGPLSEVWVSILDNDDNVATFLFDTTFYGIFENDEHVVVKLLRNGDQRQSGGVRVITSSEGSAEVGLDFHAVNERVIFGVGQIETYIKVDVVNDNAVEDDEYFLLQLTEAENGAIGNPDKTHIAVANDDAVFNLEKKRMFVNEWEENIVLTVNRTGYIDTYAAAVLSVDVDSAKFEDDFIGSLTNLHFTNGQTSASTTIDIVNDDIPEPNENFQVSLTVLQGGFVGHIDKTTVTIFDDERVQVPGNDEEPGNSSDDKHEHSTIGPKIAGALGGVVGILTIVLITLCLYYRYKVLPTAKANIQFENPDGFLDGIEMNSLNSYHQQLGLNNFMLQRPTAGNQEMQLGFVMDIF